MSFVHHYRGSQFQHQNVFRTISLGFQPYFPETQRYKMQLDTETFDPSAQQGYWKLGPAPVPSEADTRKIPWAIRQLSYDAQAPPGRLETLNTYSRKNMALRSASQIDLGLESSKLAGELSQLIKAGYNDSFLARKWEISDTAELELTILGRDLEEVALYGEVKSLEPRSTRKSMDESLKEDIPLGGQGLDLYFDEHLGVREGMKSVIGSKQVRKSVGMEVSTAAPGTKKLSMVRDFENLQDANEQFGAHVEIQIEALNDKLMTEMDAIYEEGPLSHLKGTSKEVEMTIVRTLREKFAAGTSHTMSSFARRLLSRHHEVLGYQIVKDMTKDRFIEQVNLGGGYQGIVVLRGEAFMPDVPEKEGKIELQPGAIPQFFIELTKVVTGKSLSSILFQWGIRSLQDLSKLSLLKTMDKIQQEAMDQSTMIPGRVEWLNRVKQGEFELSALHGLSLAIGKAKARPGEMGLTTMGIAKGLELKIRTVLSGEEYKSHFYRFYNKMMDASNKLSTQWKSAVPVGHVHHASISQEWTFGDNRGNPHKKYLGIWGPTGRTGAAYDNWKDSERVMGENVSISPWLVSRRAGVASFGQ